MELPDLSKLKLKTLTCEDCISRSKEGKIRCYVHKKEISLKKKACKSVKVDERKEGS